LRPESVNPLIYLLALASGLTYKLTKETSLIAYFGGWGSFQIPAGSQVSLPCRFGQTITPAALKHPVYGGLQVHLMTDRNIDQLRARLGSQCRADNLSLVD
jgi:hypothetical protein